MLCLALCGPSSASPAAIGLTIFSSVKVTLSAASPLVSQAGVPGLGLAVDALLTIMDAVEEARDNTDQLEDIAVRIERIWTAIIQPALEREKDPNFYVSAELAERLRDFDKNLRTACTKAEDLSSYGFIRRVLKRSEIAGEVKKICQLIEDAFDQFTASGTITMEMLLNQILTEIRRKDALAANLHGYKVLAHYNSKDRNFVSRCLEGTRVHIFKEFEDWFTKESSPIFWLSGFAGTGKSTIAQTIAEDYAQKGHLGASYFFSVDRQDINLANVVFPTIAYQLADFDPLLSLYISQSIEQHPMSANLILQEQFRYLILDPLKRSTAKAPILIVIDALDQCNDQASVREVINLFCRQISSIPLRIKILITSRPEHHIRSTFKPFVASNVVHPLPLLLAADSDAKLAHKDILLFFQHHLRLIGKDMLDDPKWPSDHDITALVDKAQGFFIFAATAVKFIGDERRRKPRKRLAIILDNSRAAGKGTYADVDVLYQQVLENFLPKKDFEDILDTFQMVVGSLVLLSSPLSVRSLAAFLNIDIEEVESVTDYLHAVLIVPPSRDDDIHICHPSFHEFITDNSRCTDTRFFIDPVAHHTRLAIKCLETALKPILRRNICSISDSSLLNSEIPDLPERFAKNVPRHVQYACFHWADHCRLSFPDDTLLELIDTFSVNKLLCWMEVLSLSNHIPIAVSGLQGVLKWYRLHNKPHNPTIRLLDDAYRFVLQSLDVIGSCAAHVYISALLFSPPSSLLDTYRYEIPRSISVLEGRPTEWSSCLRVLEGHSSEVYGLKTSSDGSYIGSASRDGTVRIWDGETGICTRVLDGDNGPVGLCGISFSPDNTLVAAGDDNDVLVWDIVNSSRTHSLKGHTEWVYETLFVPGDNNCVVSVSRDMTIRFWDLSTSSCTKVLEGHTGWIVGMAFSSDGSLLATGAYDKTARVWNTRTGETLQEFGPHPDIVRPVLFTPDDSCVITGAKDSAIRIWDIQSGNCLQVLLGHLDWVRCMSLSPDGLYLASGSQDRTVRVWSMKTKECIMTFEGHTEPIYGVAFCQDGRRIVSGSRDYSMRIWELDSESGRTGETCPEALNWFILSPDGSLVASGSRDSVVRIWDLTNGSCSKELRGHEGEVDVLAFSEDSSRLVSGSKDKRVCVWSTSTWTLIHTFQGHAEAIKSLAFFPSESRRVVSGSDDGVVYIWESESGIILKTWTYDAAVWAVAVSPDKSLVVSGCHDSITLGAVNWIRVWNTENDTVDKYSGHKDCVCSLVFSPDGSRLAAGDHDAVVRIWSTKDWQCLLVLRGHSDPVRSVAFSLDGTRIYSETFSLNFESFTWDSNTGTRVEVTVVPPRFKMNPDGWLLQERPYDPLTGTASTPGKLVNKDPSSNYIRLCWIPSFSRGWKVFSVPYQHGYKILTFGQRVVIVQYQ